MNEEEQALKPLKLSNELYDVISGGADIREMCRSGEPNLEMEVKIQAAILLLMYRRFPFTMTENEIWEQLQRGTCHLMNDEEFRTHTAAIVLTKIN